MNLRVLVRRAAEAAQVEAGIARAAVIGTLVVLVVAATCVRLGIWQLDRLGQRRALNALASERMAQPAIDVERLGADSATAAFRRIRLTGSCEGEPIVLAARSRHGAPGVHLLCRFVAADGRPILLDRGWLPSADARTIERARLEHAPRDTTLEALAIPFPRGRATARAGGSAGEPAPRVIYRLNRAQAEAVLGTSLPAWYAQAIGPDSVLPIPPDPPALDEGPHLGYAVQWFSFATIALIGWLVLAIRRRPAPVFPPPM